MASSSNCPHCWRCLIIEHNPSTGASANNLASLNQDFGGTSSCGSNGINYVLYGTTAQAGDPTVDNNQGHLTNPASNTASSSYGENLWLFEEGGSATGRTWGTATQITSCASSGMTLGPLERLFWHLSTCCEVVWVTTNDPATAVVVPETDPSALYMASKLTNTWSLWVVEATQCSQGTFPPKPKDGTGNFLPATIPSCGVTGSPGSANSFTASALHIACSQSQSSGTLLKFLTVTFAASGTYCGSDVTTTCLVNDWFVDYYGGVAAGSNWCPPESSFPQGKVYGQGTSPYAPRMIYGSCEEIPCAYIGDGNGNWLPFQSCPNIEDQVCVCQPHPTEPSEYAGQMYITNCGGTQ